jgi:predicted nucleotidyltransferase
MERDFIEELKKYLIGKYNCHLIILYGSYITGDFTDESDVDIICFSDRVCPENDTSVFRGFQLDVWIYGSEKIKDIEQYLRVRNGKIIYDEKDLGNNFLNQIEQEYIKGPQKLNDPQKQFLKDWINKMYKRSQKGDLEGNFRFHWILVDSLEIYFNLKGLWYLGPKKSLKWLKSNDIMAYNIFESAYDKNMETESIEKLVKMINEL